MKRFRTFAHLFFSVSLALLLITGCAETSGPDSDDVEEQEEDITNPNLPNSNQLIVNVQTNGDPTKESSVWDMDENPTGGFFFEGLDDFIYCAGSLAETGTPLWQHAITFRPQDIMTVQTDRFSGALAVGWHEVDAGAGKEQAIVSLIDAGGDVQYELVVADTSADHWFNAVTMFSDSVFLCVGGAYIVDTRYPFMSVVYLKSDSTLSTGSVTTMESLPHDTFRNVEVGNVFEQDGATHVDCYTAGVQAIDDMEHITLHALRCPVDSLENSEILWNRDIVAYPGLNTTVTSGDGLTYHNGTLYIAGSTDANKDPAPSSGGYWPAGLVASVATDGTVNWIKPVVLSQYSDYYHCVYVTDQALYAIGEYSSFWNHPSERLFGYGLVSSFDLATGEEKYHLSFGDEHYRSAFNTFHVEGSTAWVGGWTNEHLHNGGHQSWFAEIDLNSPMPTPVASANGRSAENVGIVDNCIDDGGWRPEE